MNATLAGSKEDLIAQLTQEHRRLDERCKQLERQISLTSAEQVEYSQLKKRKLLTKDRLARLRA